MPHPESPFRPLSPSPPGFVMWNDLPPAGDRDWKRQWFGHELMPSVAFNVRGIGIREPMFNADVHRPSGTGDWLVMLFHEAPRLMRRQMEPSHPPLTMMIWPPSAEQFYSWGRQPDVEAHSWIHVEGTFVREQIERLGLPVRTPIPLPGPGIFTAGLDGLLQEMQEGATTDPVILQNLFENLVRGIRRQTQVANPTATIPAALVEVRRYLDADYRRIPPLEELTDIAAMSRSHLCHRFREYYGSTISEYVIRKRMAAAQRLLYEVNLRPGDIAEAVGYRDIYQFSKQFKKSFGVSPTEYRKQQGVRVPN